MKIALILSLLLGLSAFADDNTVQPTPSDNGPKASGVDNSSESAIVPATHEQRKQLEENKKQHEQNLKNKPAKAKAKGHAKKAGKKAKKKAPKKPKQ